MIEGLDHGVVIINQMDFIIFVIESGLLLFLSLQMFNRLCRFRFLIILITTTIIGPHKQLTELIFLFYRIEDIGLIGGFVHVLDDVFIWIIGVSVIRRR